MLTISELSDIEIQKYLGNALFIGHRRYEYWLITDNEL